MNTHDFTVRAADGSRQDLREYAGQVLLIVNVASQCGLTPQYAGLESLYRDGQHRGLRVLGFPCNQFGGQEPGTDAEIQQFCSTTYQVTFPVFGKMTCPTMPSAFCCESRSSPSQLRTRRSVSFKSLNGFLYFARQASKSSRYFGSKNSRYCWWLPPAWVSAEMIT